MLVVNDDEVRELLPMHECVDVLDRLFQESARGETSNMSRYRMPLPRGSHQVMAGTVPSLDATGLKTYVSSGAGGSQMVVLIYSIQTARPIVMLSANGLGAIRTGAASGVATRYMARPESSTAGIIGSGSQARTQLAAVCVARPIKQALVYSRKPENREAFAKEMSSELGISVQPVDTPEEACEADVVCVITNSREPVVDGNAFREGTHINAAGSNNWMRRELDETAIKRAALVVVDDLADARIECGELIWAVERRAFRWEKAVELRDVVGGRVPGRPSTEAITLFESQGLAIEDVAAGMHVYHKALERGVGRQLDLS